MNVLIPLYSDSCELYSSLLLSFCTIITYPLFNFFLITKTKLFTPIIKGWNYSDFSNLNKREYIIQECQKLIKYNIQWVFLVISPIIISFVINKNLFAHFTFTDLFTFVVLFYLLAHLWVLSAIMRNFYLKYYWLLITIPGLILEFYIAFIPQNSINFLLLTISLTFLTFLSGVILVFISKNQQ